MKRLKSKKLKDYLDTHKVESLVVGPVERLLLANEVASGGWSGRRWDVIHPSELAKPDWCARAAYYRIVKGPLPPDATFLQREIIFEEGHEYHRKWQNWIWDLGKLRGRFLCVVCRHRWTATSPNKCPSCGAPRCNGALVYKEVAVDGEDRWLISGRSDGDIDLNHTDGDPNSDDPLLEIKSIGEGTVRMEAPKLLTRHTHEVEVKGKAKKILDMRGLWRDIRRPFPSHLIQGGIYAAVLGRPKMLYVYEFKPTGATKEFLVTHNPDHVAHLLDACLDVKHAVQAKQPPSCRAGKKGCANCRAYEETTADEASDQGTEPVDAGGGEGRQGEGEGEARGAAPTEQAGRRGPARAQGPGRPPRPGTDGGVRDPHSLGGLLERAAGAGGDRRRREGSGTGARPRPRARRVVRGERD